MLKIKDSADLKELDFTESAEKLAIEKLIIGLTFKDVIRGSKEFNKGFDLACDSIKERIVNILKELKGDNV